MKTDSVVIVGNGASLLGSGCGPFIDMHDVVVRFNLFKTTGFGHDVGSKVTVWFSNRDACSPFVRAQVQSTEAERIYVHTWQKTREAVTSFHRVVEEYGKAISVFQVEKSILADMVAFFGKGYSMFSTGLIGTWIMLQEYQAVSLVGFDWWKLPQRFHYCDNAVFQPIPGKGHQPEVERRCLAKLEALGRVTLIECHDTLALKPHEPPQL
jgi:hypothetical protein